MATRDDFMNIVTQQVALFKTNQICQNCDNGTLSESNYRNMLLMLFHQTFEGPSTFALAAAHCPAKYYKARDYLLHHADEEKNHWEWVINDLKNTGYVGPDPKELFPQPMCQVYVAFNVYTAMRYPLGRLAIAAVLESIGATHGKYHAQKTCEILKLKPNQVTFFFGHGDTDVGHTEELLEIIDACDLDEKDWDMMCHCAKVAGQAYTAMYDEVGRMV